MNRIFLGAKPTYRNQPRNQDSYVALKEDLNEWHVVWLLIRT